MRKSTRIQKTIKENLDRYFPEVIIEWNMAKDARDAFSPSQTRYAPRLDVAVGPFNISPDYVQSDIENKFSALCPMNLKDFLRSHTLSKNSNPRCTIGIEVVCSGSSKHILGDFTNASMMGLYGIIIPDSPMLNKVKRLYEYVKILKSVGKSPPNMFNNLTILSSQEFINLL
jgi:hypothetical protein